MATRWTPERSTTFSAAVRIAPIVASDRRLRLRRRTGCCAGSLARCRLSRAATAARGSAAFAVTRRFFLLAVFIALVARSRGGSLPSPERAGGESGSMPDRVVILQQPSQGIHERLSPNPQKCCGTSGAMSSNRTGGMLPHLRDTFVEIVHFKAWLLYGTGAQPHSFHRQNGLWPWHRSRARSRL